MKLKFFGFILFLILLFLFFVLSPILLTILEIASLNGFELSSVEWNTTTLIVLLLNIIIVLKVVKLNES